MLLKRNGRCKSDLFNMLHTKHTHDKFRDQEQLFWTMSLVLKPLNCDLDRNPKSFMCLDCLNRGPEYCIMLSPLPSVGSDFCMRTFLPALMYRWAGGYEFRSLFSYLPEAAKQCETWSSSEKAFTEHHFSFSGTTVFKATYFVQLYLGGS